MKTMAKTMGNVNRRIGENFGNRDASPQSRMLGLEEVSTGSGSDQVCDRSRKSSGISHLITHQVATASCTDLFQVRHPTFEAKRIAARN
jgi:hypothetical protein